MMQLTIVYKYSELDLKEITGSISEFETGLKRRGGCLLECVKFEISHIIEDKNERNSCSKSKAQPDAHSR